jgi:hypothetical protein
MVVKPRCVGKSRVPALARLVARYLANPEVACADPLCSPKHVFVCWQTGMLEGEV